MQIAERGFAVELKWAVIYSIMFVGWMLLERSAGLHDARLDLQPMIGPLILIPSLLIYLRALQEKRRKLGGAMTYRQGFLTGCLLTALILLLTPINQALTSNVISPDYFANLTEYTVTQGALTREQAQQQFNFGNYLRISLVAGAVTGIVFSAILAGFTRSRSGRHSEAAPGTRRLDD